jgi:hypothetical protein
MVEVRERMSGTNRSRTAGRLEGEVKSAEAFAFQRRSWTVERVAWVMMVLLVIAGLHGLFGGGPVGGRVPNGEGVELHYEALVRSGTPQAVEVRGRPGRRAAWTRSCAGRRSTSFCS